AAGRAHRPDHRLQTVEHSDQVHLQDHPEVCHRLVLDVLAGRHTRVVHQTVECAELGECELHRVRPLLGIGDVEMGVPRLRAEFTGQLFAIVVEQISEHNVAAARDYVACERPAEAARAAGDDHYL